MQQLGADYRLVKRLAGGAVAEVYLVEGQGPGQMVLKVIRKELTTDAAAVARFLEEIRILSGLTHANVVKHMGAGKLPDGRVYLLTEAYEGENLQSHLGAQGPVGPLDAIKLMVPLTEALEHVHQNGVLHGDIKPDNVFLSGGLFAFKPRLLDFGLAHFEGKLQGRTLDGVAPSTPEFTAPECRAGEPPTAKSDLYALGALLFATLTGAPPFFDPSPSQMGLRHLNDPLPPLPQSCAALEPLVQKLMAKRPEDRFRSAGELLEALRALDARPLLVSPFSPVDLAPPVLERPGDTVGNYELVKLLGEGSMGRVFQARHTRLGRQVALKILRPEHAHSPDLIQRFFQEARTVNQINHEHIVEILDFVAETGADGMPRAYCVMELLVGHSLSEVLRREALPVQRTVSVVQQICAALSAAHASGVVHRDVKPDNIFLVERSGVRDYVKVLDFGVAKLVRPIGDLPSGATVNGAIIGTPTYMSPEQATGLGAEERSDIYSVGVVLYEALAGRVPFEGASFGQLVVQIATHAPPPLPEVTPAGEALPAALREQVLRCLAKDPDERPRSMTALSSALSAAVGEPGAIAQAPLQLTVEAELPRARSWKTPAALVALLAISATVVTVAVRRHPPEPIAPVATAATPPPVAAPVEAPPPPPTPAPIAAVEKPAPATVILTVSSRPQGAEVRRADTHELWGTTPLQRELPRGPTPLVVQLSHPGYEPAERTLQLDANALVDVSLAALPKAPAAKPKKTAAKKVSHEGVIDAFPE